MERNKSNNRTQKKITSHLGSEFFALGSKSSRDDQKKVQIDRKRESTSTVSNVSKKPKLISNQRSSEDIKSYELWEQMATECDPIDLIETIYAAIDQNDNDTVLRILCGSVKLLSLPQNRTKVDFIQYLSLFYVAKLYPSIFLNDMIISALLHSLRRETNCKHRLHQSSFIISTNILTASFIEKLEWPEIFFRVFIDDAMNERIWVDSELCHPFVQNILAIFQTTIPHNSLLFPEGLPQPSAYLQSRDVTVNVEEDMEFCTSVIDDPPSGSCIDESLCAIKKRFVSNEKVIEKIVIDAVKEQLNRRQHQDCQTRNFVKFLCSVVGIGEIRNMCISRLELWIHNGKLVKSAQQLLAYICYNIKSTYPKDQEVLATLIKMRLKTKPLINFYMTCLKEIIVLQPETLRIVLKLVVQNELSNTRNPNNMGMLATMFQTFPEQSAIHLAEIYNEYLLQRDDCLRTLRVFLRELVKMLRFDMDIIKFCQVFLNGCSFYLKQLESSEFKDRIFQSMVDLTCLCMFLTVSPQVREATLTIRTTREINSNSVLVKFFKQMSTIQLEAVTWMYQIVPNIFKTESTDYKQALYKLLLLENIESYSRSDQWPSEPERSSLLRLISETPVHEESLMRIILIGITKDIPFSTMDTIDVIMLVIKRASSMKVTNYPAIESTKFDIIDFLFSMAEYHHPENIKLPPKYEPPKLAITVLYWKVWLIMLMISAHNPGTFGAFCWSHYPTMKMMIEMCITNQFDENHMAKTEIQILSVEREHILEFETYLASQTITEENTILISQLMLMDPMGPARKIPPLVLEQLKFLNKSLKLGHLLCRCRKPDLLLDIIQRQGTTQSMPWLSDLVQNNDGDFSHLPVQCLCEFLLFSVKFIKEENSRDAALVDFLKKLVIDTETSKQTLCEVLDYVFRRLSSSLKQSRVAAIGGLRVIFDCANSTENNWLLQCLPEIPHFKYARPYIIAQLRSACQVENSPELIMAYIKFIATHTLDDNVTDTLDHVFDMAQLIVERSTMFQHITPMHNNVDCSQNPKGNLDDCRLQTLKCLFVMFNNYIIKLKEHHDPYEWNEYPDLLMVQFEDGVQLPLHINIIHAFIILLTYSNSDMPETNPIFEYWFSMGRFTPIAFLPGTVSDSVQLLPDWLKLRMIRSSVDKLVEAALYELTPDQIVLFVQNFGTPINSMSKLLALFDRAVIEQLDTVKNAILNKTYLSQLISVQQSRGAKNGHFTIQALKLDAAIENTSNTKKLVSRVYEQCSYSNIKSSIFCEKNLKCFNEEDFFRKMETQVDIKNNEHWFRSFIFKLLKKNFDLDVIKNILPNTISTICIRSFQNINESNDFNEIQRQYLCTLIRILIWNYKQYSLFEGQTNGLNNFITITDNNDNMKRKFSNLSCFVKSVWAMIQIPCKIQNSIKPILVSLKKKFLQSTFCNDMKNNGSHNLICRNGILVDWISVIDPELDTINYHLFYNNCSEFRYFLLSRMCHQTNWAALVSILNCVLKEMENMKSTHILDFIEALIENPKLWQGRDKSVSKSENLEIIFSLCPRELKILTNLILDESHSEFLKNESKCNFKLYSRMNLLSHVISTLRFDLIRFLTYIEVSSYPQLIKNRVVQQVYLKYPSIKYVLPKQTEQFSNLQNFKGCQVDKVSNYLITCLGNLLQKKDYESLSGDTELLIRKLASTHPLLLLRQLGVLSSLIQGRDQLKLKALKDEYHYHRFIQILRLLELLEDVIFEDIYEVEFQNILNCYFKFLRHNVRAKESFNILIKFVDLLHVYLCKNPKNACILMEQHVHFLLELASRFHNLGTLHHLVNGISLLQKQNFRNNELSEDEPNQDYDINERVVKTSTNAVNASEADISDVSVFSSIYMCGNSVDGIASLPYNCNKIEAIPPHFYNLIKTIKEANSDESVICALQEVEILTSRRYYFLGELFDRLLEFLFSCNTQVRSFAYILLIRFLKYNPGRSDFNRCTLNAYSQCLRSENYFIAATAVDNLDQMTILLQEYAVEILSVAFSLGLRSKLNTIVPIKRVTQSLLLQYGY